MKTGLTGESGRRLLWWVHASVVVLVGAVFLNVECGTALADAVADGLVSRAADAVKKKIPAAVTERRKDADWLWVQTRTGDEQFPITVDFLAARKMHPARAIYMLSPSGVNFQGVFMGAGTNGLAHFLAQRGYVVVGITAREDRVPTNVADSVMSDWGLAKHRDDVRKVVSAVQPHLRLPHDMLSFSFSGAVALDYCGTYADDPERLFVLDIHTLDPSNALDVATAAVMESGYETLLSTGAYVDASLSDLRSLLGVAAVYPQADSGIAREWFGLPPGDFTVDGMLHFWLICSGILPGIHTHLTGLPRDWPLIMSTTSGWYMPSTNALEDVYGLYFTRTQRLNEVAAVMGSGKIPLAFLRDMTSATGHCGDYRINWAGIRSKVRWVNAELGYGTIHYGADLIRAGGNANVGTFVVPGYGNADVVFSETAEQDVWRLFVE